MAAWTTVLPLPSPWYTMAARSIGTSPSCSSRSLFLPQLSREKSFQTFLRASCWCVPRKPSGYRPSWPAASCPRARARPHCLGRGRGRLVRPPLVRAVVGFRREPGGLEGIPSFVILNPNVDLLQVVTASPAVVRVPVSPPPALSGSPPPGVGCSLPRSSAAKASRSAVSAAESTAGSMVRFLYLSQSPRKSLRKGR